MSKQSHFPGASHLECTGTGEIVESEQLIGLSAVGKPLFARYDLDAVADRFTPDAVAGREAGLWRYEEVLPAESFRPSEAGGGLDTTHRCPALCVASRRQQGVDQGRRSESDR